MNISRNRKKELTGFQEAAPYQKKTDIRTDFVMPYAADDSLCSRIERWRERGYVTHFMTGIAWGGALEYLKGEYDGTEHWDEGARDRWGNGIDHGPECPYMIPSVAYADFLFNKLKKVVDWGITDFHLEEPEIWCHAGYSEGFKREYEIYYNEKWIPQHTSPDAYYRSSKLKSYLYTRTLERLCTSLKSYAKYKYNRELRFFVPTHSLLNYCGWGLVSPESRLLDVPAIDGYIAQIWTGTARIPNLYEGVRKERTFETAYLEYGVMQELTRGTNRHMWFLHDPIEDDPKHTWEDYKYNYYKTLTASLLHHNVHTYEVAPWPDRVFNGKYPNGDPDAKPIPPSYAVELNIAFNALRDMDQDDTEFKGNTSKIGVAVSDSCLFQLGDFTQNPDDMSGIQDFSGFFALSLPLLKYGLPVKPVQLDNIRRQSSYLDEYDMVVMSYEYMKPEFPDIHSSIAQWVRAGGVLAYIGNGKDVYHSVREWWNQGNNKYMDPAEHLFECLELNKNNPSEKKSKRVALENDREAAWIFKCGKGFVLYMNESPKEIAGSKSLTDDYRKAIKSVISYSKKQTLNWKFSNNVVLNRGPYIIGACFDESYSSSPLVLNGMFVDLKDSRLPVKRKVIVRSDENCFLYNIEKSPLGKNIDIGFKDCIPTGITKECANGGGNDKAVPCGGTAVSADESDNARLKIVPLAASCRVELATLDEVKRAMSCSNIGKEYKIAFSASGPSGVKAVIRFAYEEGYEPESVFIYDAKKRKEIVPKIDAKSRTFLVEYPNEPEGTVIVIR